MVTLFLIVQYCCKVVSALLSITIAALRLVSRVCLCTLITKSIAILSLYPDTMALSSTKTSELSPLCFHTMVLYLTKRSFPMANNGIVRNKATRHGIKALKYLATLSTSNSSLTNTSQTISHQKARKTTGKRPSRRTTELSTTHISPCATKKSTPTHLATTRRKAGSAIATGTDVEEIVEYTSSTSRSEGTATIAKPASERRGTASHKAQTSSDTNQIGGCRDNNQQTEPEPTRR